MRGEDNINMHLREVWCEDVRWMEMTRIASNEERVKPSGSVAQRVRQNLFSYVPHNSPPK